MNRVLKLLGLLTIGMSLHQVTQIFCQNYCVICAPSWSSRRYAFGFGRLNTIMTVESFRRIFWDMKAADKFCVMREYRLSGPEEGYSFRAYGLLLLLGLMGCCCHQFSGECLIGCCRYANKQPEVIIVRMIYYYCCCYNQELSQLALIFY